MLRCIWILTLSTDIRERTKSAALYTLICGFLEMVRRCIWNFLRVEMEHQKNQKDFRVVEKLSLPYKINHEQEGYFQDLFLSEFKPTVTTDESNECLVGQTENHKHTSTEVMMADKDVFPRSGYDGKSNDFMEEIKEVVRETDKKILKTK